MHPLVFDIETIPDPNIPHQPKREGDFPPLACHQIVTIGYFTFAEDFVLLSSATQTEDEIVRSFVDRIEHTVVDGHRPRLVSWNGRGFDLPLLCVRALRAGLCLRRWTSKDTRYRYSTEHHFDVKDKLSDFGAASVGSLDQAAKLVGFPGKIGVDGSMVASMVAEGRQAEVDRYCLCDVAQTAAIFLRTRLLLGEVDLASYRRDASMLLEHVDDRLGELAEKIDRDAFLLTRDRHLADLGEQR